MMSFFVRPVFADVVVSNVPLDPIPNQWDPIYSTFMFIFTITSLIIGFLILQQLKRK